MQQQEQYVSRPIEPASGPPTEEEADPGPGGQINVVKRAEGSGQEILQS